MDKKYTFVSAKEHPDLVNRLTEYEKDLGKKIGHDVVLIAYTEDKKQ